VAIENLHAPSQGIRNVDPPLAVNAESKWALITAFRSNTQPAQRVALWEKYLNETGMEIRNVDCAAGIDRNGARRSRGWSFEAEQRNSRRFEFLHEPGRPVRKIDPANRISCESDRVLKLPRFVASDAPLLNELNGSGLHCNGRLRVRTRAAK